MKKKLVANIVCLNSQYVHSSLAPWCLLAGVKEYGQDRVSAFVTEGTVNEGAEPLLERLLSREWDVIGFCCYIWNISLVRTLCRELKARKGECTVVLGGPEVGYTPEESLKDCPEADYVLTGPGEESFALLCCALANGEEVRVSGCTGRKGGLAPRELACPPSPYTEEYFSALKGRMAYLETMRGCPYSCAFCLSGRKESLVFFPLERVKRELLALGNSGTQTIKLVDRSFNADPVRAAEIVSFLLEHRGDFPQGLCIHFEIEGMSLSEDLARLFCSAPAGFFRLELGVQSTNAATLRAVHRRDGGQELFALIARLAASGVLRLHTDLIVGLPYEDLQSFQEGFNTLFLTRPHEIQVGFLKVLKGTPMRDRERFVCDYSAEAPYEVLQTPWLSKDEVAFLKRFAHTVEKVYNSGKYALTLEEAMKYFPTPYDLFADFTRELEGEDHRQDRYADALYVFLSARGMKGEQVRDLLVQDRLASCAPTLPPLLKSMERQGLRPKKLLEKRFGAPTGRRGAAVLWQDSRLVFCDYDGGPYCQRDPVTGRYRLFLTEGP